MAWRGVVRHGMAGDRAGSGAAARHTAALRNCSWLSLVAAVVLCT
jgi:hypothetical protein